jgi:serine/threonine protein kinase
VGVIHGDLRPSKVFLTDSSQPFGGLVRVVGFGTWRLVGNRQGPGVMAETARFCAPELTRVDVDGRADQFSLAAMAYLMLTGEQAFPGDDVAAVMRAVQEGQPRPMHEIADVDRAVDTVVRRGLTRQPEHRYGSAVEFAAALARAVGSDNENLDLPLVDSTDPGKLSALPRAQREFEGSGDWLPIGQLEEAARWPEETPPPYRAALERQRARHARPVVLGALLLFTLGLGTAHWSGWRPPGWQHASAWAHGLVASVR